MTFLPKTRVTLSQVVSMGQSDEVDEKAEIKQEVLAHMKEMRRSAADAY